MITRIFKLTILSLFIPMFSFSFNAPVPQSVTFSCNANGEILDVVYSTSWTNGNINQFYLDFAHTQKTFNDITLEPGQYQWTVQTIKRNNKKGKVNFDITNTFQNGSSSKVVDKRFSPGRTDNGSFNVVDYKSQSGGSSAGYGKIKVHIGRAGANTNVNYKITLTKTSGGNGNTSVSATSGSGNGSNSGNGNNSNCNYTTLGSKSGNVLGNTVGKYTSTKKACQNSVTVRVNKTGGKARTTVLVYASSTKNGTGTLKDSVRISKWKWEQF